MVKTSLARFFLLLAAVTLGGAATASAQFTPRALSDPATGESYHIEGSVGLWHPTTSMSITSESLGIPGSTIDFKKDLGLTDQTFREYHVVLRPTRRNKLRFQFIPIKFSQEAILARDVVFQGIRYKVGLPVNSQLDWKAYRFAYEFDFVSRNRGFAGFMLDAKYTDVFAGLQSPIDYETLHARAPIPTIGGIGRYYVVPNISITGELSGFKIPDSVSKDHKGHYADLDIYGTLNVTNNIGAQFGYRSFDLGYTVKNNDTVSDAGSFVVKGLYFGLVARY